MSYYKTLQLITDLLGEMKRHKIQLAAVFPEKIKCYPSAFLSRLWKGNLNFILKSKLKYKNEGIYDEIGPEDLNLLRTNLIQKYGEDRLKCCFEIIESYENHNITIIHMIEMLTQELGRISLIFPVTKKLLSLMFGMDENFISTAVERRIKKENRLDYNPNYKFSLEQLELLEINLGLNLGQNSKQCINFIKKYKKLNPGLKEYSRQKFNCYRPHVFKELNEESAYWLGFLVADGYINEYNYKIQLSLSIKDKLHLEKFAEFVGVNKEYYVYYVYLKYKGELRRYRIVRLSFGCKSMVKDLKTLGFFETRGKMNMRRLPNSILFHIMEAKKIGGDWCKSKSGRIALAFLLGYFDGDGHYYGGLCGTVFSSSRAFLENLKKVYCIDNEIRMKLHKSVPGDSQIIYVKEFKGEGIRPSYHLTLGTELYRKMIKSYNNGLERKKPLPEIGKEVLTIRFNY